MMKYFECEAKRKDPAKMAGLCPLCGAKPSKISFQNKSEAGPRQYIKLTVMSAGKYDTIMGYITIQYSQAGGTFKEKVRHRHYKIQLWSTWLTEPGPHPS